MRKTNRHVYCSRPGLTVISSCHVKFSFLSRNSFAGVHSNTIFYLIWMIFFPILFQLLLLDDTFSCLHFLVINLSKRESWFLWRQECEAILCKLWIAPAVDICAPCVSCCCASHCRPPAAICSARTVWPTSSGMHRKKCVVVEVPYDFNKKKIVETIK